MAESTESDVENAPERFDPQSMRGELIEAEHLVRYRWASRLAAGRRTLDAGCGMAYGTRMLAAAGASETVGIDLDEATVVAVRDELPDGVTLDVGDLRDLPYEDGSFDLVVCFEVLEHVEETSALLDELRRVLRPGGVLAISTPNRDVYTPGNPHHLHELTPVELEAVLRERFEQVVLLRQGSWVASGVFDEETFGAEREAELEDLRVTSLAEDAPGGEIYTIALAGEGALPAAGGELALTQDVDLRRWSEMWQDQRAAIDSALDEAARREAEIAALRSELTELREQLVGAEAELASLHDLGARQDELDSLLGEVRALHAEYLVAVDSRSWRYTRLLRAVAQRAQRVR